MAYRLLVPETINRNNLDLIRFLLATSVIVCHCYVTYYDWERFVEFEPFMKWSGGKISIGSAAVNFFFVISGFLIVRSYEHSAAFWEFLKKRMLRIYPGFIAVFILGFLVFAPIGHMNEWSVDAYIWFLKSVRWKREIAYMLSLQAPDGVRYFANLPSSGLNASLWTIQYEFICYLLVPALAFLGFTKSKLWFIIALLISYVLFGLQSLGYIFPWEQSPKGGIIGNPYFYPRFFTYFLSGTFTYIYRNILPRSVWLMIFSLVLFLLAFKFRLFDIVWPLSGTYLLFYFAYPPEMIFPNFAKHGDFSYGIYLYGWPLQQLVMLFLGSYLNVYTFFVVVYPIILVFSLLSWKLIESPALKLKKRSSH